MAIIRVKLANMLLPTKKAVEKKKSSCTYFTNPTIVKGHVTKIQKEMMTI